MKESELAVWWARAPAVSPDVDVTQKNSLDSADSFGQWVAPHWQPMAKLAYRLTSHDEWEDVLQASLEAAWRKREQFDPDRGSAQSWLLAVVADQARKSWRKRRPERLPETSAIEVGSLSDDDTSLEYMDLVNAIKTLTDRQRLAVELFYFSQLQVTMVARIMKCSEGTVKSTLAEARSKLRRSLGSEYK